MGILTRLVQKLDDNLATVLDRHLETVIPAQRTPSDEVPRPLFEVAGYWFHCPCCGQGCTDIHRDRCQVHQPEDAA